MATKFYTSINLNNNQLQNVVLNPQSSTPGTSTAGLIYFDSTTGQSFSSRLVIKSSDNSKWLTIPYGAATDGTVGSIVNNDIASTAAITVTKLLTSGTNAVTLSSVGLPTADVSFNSKRITNVLTDSSSALTDAATKGYVDAAVAGLNVHAPVDAATTGSETYTAVGTAITQISGTTVDGYTAIATDRILIKNAPATISGSASGTAGTDTTSKYNGVYTVTSVAGGNIAVQRASDYNGDVAGEVASGDYFLVLSGNSQKSFSYILSTTGTITVGTTALAFTQFSSVSSYTASNTTATAGPGGGLKLTGTAFAIDTDVTATVNGLQTLTQKTLTSPTINTPKIDTIKDVSNYSIIALTSTGSANYITIGNAASGGNPTISATGSNTNVSINLVPKGTGTLTVGTAGSTNGGVALSGSTSGTTTLKASAAASGTITLPAASGQATIKYVEEKRNGSTISSSPNTVTVNHNLNSTDVNVQVYETSAGTPAGSSSGGNSTNLVFTDVAVTDANNVTITFGSTDTYYYRVVVVA